jgi:hypothetical protein
MRSSHVLALILEPSSARPIILALVLKYALFPCTCACPSALFCSSYNTRAWYTLFLCTRARPIALFCSSYNNRACPKVRALPMYSRSSLCSARPTVLRLVLQYSSSSYSTQARPTVLKFVLHPISPFLTDILFLLSLFFSFSYLVKKRRSLCKLNRQYVREHNVHIFICLILGRSTIVYLKKRKHNLLAM